MTIKEKILIVEDEQGISNFMAAMLTANHYDVLVARTGQQARTMIASHCPDLVILDLGLPDMDGMEILRTIRSWSRLPVMVVSARTHERDKVEALDGPPSVTPVPGWKTTVWPRPASSRPGSWPLITINTGSSWMARTST